MRPDTWLLVLARDPGSAKSRLAPALEPAQRARLALAMLADVLAAASEVASAQLRVVTESPAVREAAAALGVASIDVPISSTSAAAAAGLRDAARADARGALVLASDLPLLRPSDLDAILAAAASADVVLAPDRHERGTNALLCVPPMAIEPAFGEGSLRLHEARARAAGLTSATVRTSGLAIDVDGPDDLRLVAADPGCGPHTSAVLASLAMAREA